MTTTDTSVWRVSKAGGTRMGHGWLTTSPGCPDTRHPTRWCRCAVHTSEAAAWQYIDDQQEDEDEPDDGPVYDPDRYRDLALDDRYDH